MAASSLSAATPAAAQYYREQPQSQYGQPSYNDGYGQTRALTARIDKIRQQIRWQARRGALSAQDAYRLDIQAQQLRAQLRQSAYGGTDQRERFQLERQIQRLEQRVSYPNNRYGRGTGFGGNGYQNQYQNPYQYQHGNQNQYENQDSRWQDRDGNWHDRNDERGDDRR